MSGTTTPSTDSGVTPPFGPYPAGLITNAGQIGAVDSDTIADIQYGAQLGYGPNLPQIDGATPLTLSPAVIVVTHVPTMFANVPNAPQVLKNLVERHAKEVTGIEFGLQLDHASTPIGQDGQELSMPTNSKRTPVTPTFTWPELQGNAVWNFIKTWIEFIRHPDTQASVLAATNLDSTMYPMLMSSFTMTIMVIQFDSTMRPENIIDGYFITNMWPQETGLNGTKRINGHTEMPERQIAFHGVLQHNRNTKTAAQIIAAALKLHEANFDIAVPVAVAIDANIDDMGLQAAAAEASSTFTNLDAELRGAGG